jgi:hypothetical protein
MHVHIACSQPWMYNEILYWRGYAFEASRVLSHREQRKQFAASLDAFDVLEEIQNSAYGIAESDRLMQRAIDMQIEERRVQRIPKHNISQ